jgi:glutamyl-tRNA synthetase
VVRGEDLLLSTCRQLLIYEALGGTPPAFFHTDLIRDADGCRLAKRDSALSLRALRDRGVPPEIVRKAALTGGIQQLGLRS